MEPEHITLREHLTAIMEANDRRYAEIAIEREKASEYAKQIQNYKNEQANELREQINRERGLYASKEDLAHSADKIMSNIDPLIKYVATQQGGSVGRAALLTTVAAAVALFLALGAAFAYLQPPGRGAGPGVEGISIQRSSGGRSTEEVVIAPNQ